jgi:hypothetical protein
MVSPEKVTCYSSFIKREKRASKPALEDESALKRV